MLLNEFFKNEEINAEDVRLRLRDWKDRLAKLYGDIEQWCLELNLTTDTDEEVALAEEMTARFGVDYPRLPILKVLRGDYVIFSFVPKGLWVIGANGRVDILGEYTGWTLVDVSERFDNTTDWRITLPDDRRKLIKFNKETLQYIIEENLKYRTNIF